MSNVTLEDVRQANTYNVAVRWYNKQEKRKVKDSRFEAVKLLLKQFNLGYAAQKDLYKIMLYLGEIKSVKSLDVSK